MQSLIMASLGLQLLVREAIAERVQMQQVFFSFHFRCSIFKVHLKPLKTDLDLDIVARKMAALTPGFTGKLWHLYDVVIT